MRLLSLIALQYTNILCRVSERRSQDPVPKLVGNGGGESVQQTRGRRLARQSPIASRRYRFPLQPRYNGALGQLTYASPGLANVDRSNLRPQAAPQATPALPAGAHAGAAVPLQSGLCGLREDPVSGAHS